jgi:hypothetical protein
MTIVLSSNGHSLGDALKESYPGEFSPSVLPFRQFYGLLSFFPSSFGISALLFLDKPLPVSAFVTIGGHQSRREGDR